MVSAPACRRPPVAKCSPAGARKAALASPPSGSRFGGALLPRRAGFTPQQRLHNAAEFGRVFAEPVRSSDRYFTLLARPSGKPVARLGLTISRRAAKRAVDRNRLKRLARETFRLHPRLPAWDFVLLAKPGADRAERPLLRDSLQKHFDRVSEIAEKRHG